MDGDELSTAFTHLRHYERKIQGIYVPWRLWLDLVHCIKCISFILLAMKKRTLSKKGEDAGDEYWT